MAADLGVVVAHETHRARILFHAFGAERILDRLPDLRLALDLSHWVCVGESLRPPDRILDAVAARAVHVDCRVGSEEGPQMPDPRLDRYAGHLATFEAWGDRVWAAGADVLHMAPEFGPPPYQPIDPHTGAPLADVNELKDWMAARLSGRLRG